MWYSNTVIWYNRLCLIIWMDSTTNIYSHYNIWTSYFRIKLIPRMYTIGCILVYNYLILQCYVQFDRYINSFPLFGWYLNMFTWFLNFILFIPFLGTFKRNWIHFKMFTRTTWFSVIPKGRFSFRFLFVRKLYIFIFCTYFCCCVLFSLYDIKVEARQLNSDFPIKFVEKC